MRLFGASNLSFILSTIEEVSIPEIGYEDEEEDEDDVSNFTTDDEDDDRRRLLE